MTDGKLLPPLKPIAIKERLSIIFIEKGEIDVVDGAFVVVDSDGQRIRPVIVTAAVILTHFVGVKVTHLG